MKIKEFVEGYVKIATDNLKDRYIKEKLEIVPYISFLQKDAIAKIIVERSTYRYEDYTKEDGTIGRRKTDEIRMNSVTKYILFCRTIIENYTNLEIETPGFWEEYDLLKQCGLLDKLMVGTKNTAPLIPESEIDEIRGLIEMKQQDEIFNYSEIHNYISSQVERFGTLTGLVLNPIVEKISEQLENMDDAKIEKFGKTIEKVLKKVK